MAQKFQQDVLAMKKIFSMRKYLVKRVNISPDISTFVKGFWPASKTMTYEDLEIH